MTFSLNDRVRKTYFSLRVGVAILGIIFPILLLVGGMRAGIPWEPSMSAYYHATHTAPNEPAPPCSATSSITQKEPGGMRNWFVGILFAVGAMLYVNKGFSDKENLALNVAGAMAFGIALFPMSWTCTPTSNLNMHGICAITFFAAIAFVCEFCSNETLKDLEDEQLKEKFRTAYRWLARAMIVLPGSSVILHLFESTERSHLIFLAEALGIWSFAAFWLVKTFEIRKISRQAVRGAVAAAAPGPSMAA